MYDLHQRNLKSTYRTEKDIFFSRNVKWQNVEKITKISQNKRRFRKISKSLNVKKYKIKILRICSPKLAWPA